MRKISKHLFIKKLLVSVDFSHGFLCDAQVSFDKLVIISEKLLERSHRVIPEDDIGLALWKTSIAVHCNPKNTAKSIFHRPQQSNSAEDSKETIVMDTEDIGATATGVEHTSEAGSLEV